jgi:hypothetical protein
LPGVEEDRVSVELPEPPEVRVTLVGLRFAVKPDAGTTAADRVTVPENPFRLARLIVEVEENPDWTIRLDELAEMLKSGARVTVTRIVAE